MAHLNLTETENVENEQMHLEFDEPWLWYLKIMQFHMHGVWMRG